MRAAFRPRRSRRRTGRPCWSTSSKSGASSPTESGMPRLSFPINGTDRMSSVSAPDPSPVLPSDGECGLASWEPADLAALVLPAWDEFIDIAAGVDLDASTRLTGWTARHVCVHLGSWPGSRTLDRIRAEAERDDLDLEDPRAGTFDQESHNEAVLAARAAAPRADVLAALTEGRREVAGYLASSEPGSLGPRR